LGRAEGSAGAASGKADICWDGSNAGAGGPPLSGAIGSAKAAPARLAIARAEAARIAARRRRWAG
jgi:hypothetical protein